MITTFTALGQASDVFRVGPLDTFRMLLTENHAETFTGTIVVEYAATRTGPLWTQCISTSTAGAGEYTYWQNGDMEERWVRATCTAYSGDNGLVTFAISDDAMDGVFIHNSNIVDQQGYIAANIRRGLTTFPDDIAIGGSLTVGGTTVVDGVVDDDLLITGSLEIDTDIKVDGDIDANETGALATFHDAKVDGDIEVDGTAKFDGAIDANEDGFLASFHDVKVDGDIEVDGTTKLDGNIDADEDGMKADFHDVDVNGVLTCTEPAVFGDIDANDNGALATFHDVTIEGTLTASSIGTFGRYIDVDTTINITADAATGDYDGYCGPATLTVQGEVDLVAATTGLNGGEAGVGTTTTVIKIPAASDPWTANDFNGKFAYIESGVGNGEIRLIIATAVDGITLSHAVTGLAAGDSFQIKEPKWTLTTVSASNASAPMVFNDIEFDGAVVASSSADITFNRCVFKSSGSTGLVVQTCNKANLQSCSFLDGSTYTNLSAQNCLYFLMQYSYLSGKSFAQILKCNSVYVDLDSYGCSYGTYPIRFEQCGHVSFFISATSCTASAGLVLIDQCHSSDGLITGTAGNTASYGLVIEEGGTHNIVGTSDAAGATGEVYLDGSAITWVQIGNNGITVGQYGSTIY